MIDRAGIEFAIGRSGRTSDRASAPNEPPVRPIEPVSVVTTAMGGRLSIHLDPRPAATGAGRANRAGVDIASADADGRAAEAEAAASQAIARICRWADRLSRHVSASELSLLNADARTAVRVRPTLAAALRAGIDAAEMSEGFVDIALLDARLAAESGSADDARLVPPPSPTTRSWTLTRLRRGAAIVHRTPEARFDLGGVAKGWIADRALALLASWPTVVVDADGDLAVRAAPGTSWQVGVDDPRTSGALLAVLELTAPAGGWPGRWGIATSGTSVHRWRTAEAVTHHLIDPRTGAPADTDVVQATVVCGSALRAEALAKAAVIAGSADGFAVLERARVAGAILLTDRGDVLALPSTLALLSRSRAA